jgi:hypothetical protein
MIYFIVNTDILMRITELVMAVRMFYVSVIKTASLSKWNVIEGKVAAASPALGVFSITVVISIVIAIFAPKAEAASDMEGSYFNFTSVFMGIDHTPKVSPQCVEGGTDDKLTSNLGIRQNIWQSSNKIHDVTFKYTHHSCVFSKDRNGYDGFGVEYNWYFFRS